MDCSLPGSSLHGILQARILERLPFPSPGDLPDPGIEPGSPELQAEALTSEPPGKPIQTQDPYKCCLQETHFRLKDIYRLKVREWKDIFHANGKQKKAGVAILILDKIDLKMKKITRDKEGHYIMVKGSIQEEDITVVNVYAPNIGAP